MSGVLVRLARFIALWWGCLFWVGTVWSVPNSWAALADMRSEMDIDLNASWTSPFRIIPVYSQKSSRTCYAYAGAQLLDYYRLTHGVNRNDLIQPVYAAWVSSYLPDLPFHLKHLNSGLAWASVAAVKLYGNCWAPWVDRGLDPLRSVPSMSDAELMEGLEQKYAESSYDPSMAPTIVLSRALGRICGYRDSVNAPWPTFVIRGNDRSIGRNISMSLERGQPIVAGICSRLFKNRKYRGVHRQLGFRVPREGLRKCGGHEVLITAQKIDAATGEKQFLLRNSWGSEWQARGRECACYLKSGEYRSSCNAGPEVDAFVGCWFAESNLLPNILGLTMLRDFP